MESKNKEFAAEAQPAPESQSAIPAAIREPFAALKNFVVAAYQVLCDASFVFFTSLAVVYGPVMFETERQRNKQPAEPVVEAADQAETEETSSP